MAVISYKCPNCGGELSFDPESQKLKCEYCVSLFSKEEVEELFKDNYKTYEFIKSYDNEYWKKNLQLNLAKHGYQ